MPKKASEEEVFRDLERQLMMIATWASECKVRTAEAVPLFSGLDEKMRLYYVTLRINNPDKTFSQWTSTYPEIPDADTVMQDFIESPIFPHKLNPYN